jgi:hypothetical protein
MREGADKRRKCLSNKADGILGGATRCLIGSSDRTSALL